MGELTDSVMALGASGVSTSRNLDRHWRNARTAASHNPWVYKARMVGDFRVNGTAPARAWAVGAERPPSA